MDISGISLRFAYFKGSEIETVIEGLAKLRIAVFKDFPYLYDGDFEYEKQYLKTYIQSRNSLLFAVFDGSEMVGATTCIPLVDETPEVQEPFLQKGKTLEEIFYFGESILLKKYRGLGLGKLFFEERIKHASSFERIKTVCFCAVKREENHPNKPENYKPLNEFWLKTGFSKDENMVSLFDWKDLGDEISTEKTMEYWFKQL